MDQTHIGTETLGPVDGGIGGGVEGWRGGGDQSDPTCNSWRKCLGKSAQNTDKMNIRFQPSRLQAQMEPHQDWNRYLEQVGVDRDKNAFAALFKHFAPLLKSFLIRGGAQDPEELVQETMTKVWRKAGNYSALQGSASTWVYTIARNTRIDALRQQTRQNREPPNAEDLYGDNEDQSPHSSLILLRNKSQVGQQLLELPPEQAEVLRLMYFQGKSGQQIADVLMLPIGTIKSRIRLALARLRLGSSKVAQAKKVVRGAINDK